MTPPVSIKIEIRSVYGEDKAYPACPIAERFASIANTKTLTCCTLGHVLAMGLAIELVYRGAVVQTFSAPSSLASLPVRS